jgi:hypothetical protein
MLWKLHWFLALGLPLILASPMCVGSRRVTTPQKIRSYQLALGRRRLSSAAPVNGGGALLGYLRRALINFPFSGDTVHCGVRI